MAQANPFDQFDDKAPPRPVSELKPLIGAPVKEPPLPSPTRETEQWRTMTPEEIARTPNLDPKKAYQINGAGQIKGIEGAQGKSATEIELEAKGASAQKRGDTIRAIMGRVEDLYKSDIEGQPLERLGGLTEYIGTLPKNERFSKASMAMLPLIRPLVAQTAKEGDSDKEMQVFMAYIPQASDADLAIEEKLNMLKTLIGGMVDGKPPSETLAVVAPVNPQSAQQLQQLFEQGATAEQISQAAAGLNLSIPPDMLNAAIQYRDAGGKGAALFPASKSVESGQNATMEALGAGLGDIAQGIGDVAGIVGNPLNTVINQVTGANLSTDLGASLRQATGLPANPNQTASSMIRGATSAMTGAGLSGALARGTTGAISTGLEQFAQAPLLQGAGGAGSSLGAEIARDQGAGVVGQVGASLLGGVAGAGGAKTVGAMLAPRVPVSSAVTAAQANKIPVMTSDIAPPETFIAKATQSIGERVPIVGTGPVRVQQQTARTEAVESLLNDYGVGDPATAKRIADSLKGTRSAELEKYTQMKRDVIAPLASAGDVPVPNATKAIDDEIARLERISPQGFAPAVSILRRWKSDLAGKSLDDIEVLRRQVGEEFAAPELAAVSGEAQKSLNRIYGPLRDDMGEFIRANGAPRDFVKWRVANERLKDSVDELKRTGLKNALRYGDTTPETVNNLLFSSKPSDVAALYRNLGPQGRAAARTAILDRVFKDMGDDADKVTPENFLNAVRKQGSQVRIFFSPQEAQRIEGLIDALKLTRRAGQANVMTQTGQQVAPIASVTGLSSAISAIVGADVTATALGTVLAAGAVGGLARILENPRVGAALIQLRKASPKEEQAAMKRLTAAINAVEPEQ